MRERNTHKKKCQTIPPEHHPEKGQSFRLDKNKPNNNNKRNRQTQHRIKPPPQNKTTKRETKRWRWKVKVKKKKKKKKGKKNEVQTDQPVREIHYSKQSSDNTALYCRQMEAGEQNIKLFNSFLFLFIFIVYKSKITNRKSGYLR